MIRIFTGRDSQNKRSHIYNLIKKDSTVITPEQSTLFIEKEIMDSKGVNGLIDIRVTSFKRMIDKLTSGVFDSDKEYITDVGKQMLFRYILKDKLSELKLFSSVIDKEGFIQEIIYTIETLESEGIEPEVLKSVSEDVSDSNSRDKLNDIYIIYSEYLKRVKEKYFHMSEGIRLFNEYGSAFDVYTASSVWVLGFKAFDKKALTMLSSVASNTKDLNIVISYEDDEIYEISRKTIDILKSSFDVQVVEFKSPDDKFSSFARSLLHDDEYKIEGGISLLKTNDMYSEVEYVALDIIRKLNEDNTLTPEDFRVIIGSDTYNNIIESSFNSMKLPIFSDSRRNIINSKLVKTIISLMNIYVYGFRREDVLGFLKGYINEDGWDELDRFDNYIFVNGIDRNSFFTEFANTEMEEIRRKYLGEVIKYRTHFSKTNSPRYFSERIVELLNRLGFLDTVSKRIENMNAERSDITTQVYNKVFEIISQLYIVSSDEKISFRKYLDYFKTAIKDVSVGVVPPADGSIVIASISRSVHSKCKYLYVLGVNDGVIPKDYSDEDLLKEREKELINERGYNVLSSNRNRSIIDRLDENTMLSFVTHSILFSSSGVDITGATMLDSRYAKFLEDNGATVIDAITSNEYLNELYYYDEDVKYRYIVDSVTKGGNYKFINVDRDYVDSVVDKLNRKSSEIFITKSANSLNTSVSRLELYNRCPFAYFIRYDLKAKELKEFSIDAMLKGTFLHEVLEIFFRDGYNEIFDVRGSIDKIVGSIIERDDYKVFSSSYRNESQLSRAKETLVFIARNLANKMNRSSFKAKRFEEEIFIKEKEYNLVGKIDRVDIFGDYFSIIDYKSSKREINLNEVYYGLSMQLPLYLDAYANLKSLTPAGMFYVEVKNHYSTEREERENLVKLNGLLIGDEALAREYDYSLNESNKSDYIGVSINKKDGRFSKFSHVISGNQGKLLIKKAKKNASESAASIISGDVSVKPASGIVDACKFCNYKSICRRDEVHIRNQIEKVDKEIFNILEEEFEMD